MTLKQIARFIFLMKKFLATGILQDPEIAEFKGLLEIYESLSSERTQA